MRSPAYYGWRLLFLSLASMFFWAIVMVAVSVRAESACLKRGYPRASVTVVGEAFCIRRVLQTDFVVSLAELDSARKAGGR